MTRRLSEAEAVAALTGGRVVALPTDTVYGLGASIVSRDAVAALFELKHRPSTSPLPVVAASLDDLADLVTAWPVAAQRLARAWWPGALTLVVPATSTLCALVRSATGRVGFRVPNDPALTQLLRESGPLALTSANEHGEAPCVSADEVAELFRGRDVVAGVLDGGRRDAPVSTVLDFADDAWRVVRVGALDPDALADSLA